MTVELITGHAGSAHVSSSDAGWFNAGIVGNGKYVLDTGTQFEAEVQSANLVQIGIGDALFEGRHVRVSATESVAIDNGAQGVNRNDIICIKYEYNGSTDIETASLAVIKGTATSGTATDPTIPSGSIFNGASTAYMALWRIPLTGLTVGTPVKLYGDVLVTIDELSNKTLTVAQIPNLPASKITSGTLAVDRIPTLTAGKIPSLDASKITSGTFGADRIPNLNASKITAGTLPVARGGTGVTASTSSTISTGVALQQFGKVCVLTVAKSCALTSSWASVSIGTIPSGSRPITEVHGVAIVENTTGRSAEIRVTTGGAVTVNAMGGDTLGTQYVHGSLAWICA